MNQIDIVQRVWEQNTAEMRQMDSQRATLSNIILVLDVALIGVLVGSDPPVYSIFLSVLLVALGVFGIFSVAKFYERYKYYKNRAEYLLGKLCNELDGDVLSILEEADVAHEAKYRFRVSFKAYRLWYIVHGFALIAGLYLIWSEMGR